MLAIVAPDLMTQVGQCAWDSWVTPIPVVRGHADHQLLDLVLLTRTAWASLPAGIIFLGDQPPILSHERCRRHNGARFLNHPPTMLLGLSKR
jgi:hypothetical protein